MLSGHHCMRLGDLKVSQCQGKPEQMIDEYVKEEFGTVEPGLDALHERHCLMILDLLAIKGERAGLGLKVPSVGFYLCESTTIPASNNCKLLRQVFVILFQMPGDEQYVQRIAFASLYR